LQEMIVELILQAGDQRIHTCSIQFFQAFPGRNLLGITEKAVDQIIENLEPKKRSASIAGGHAQYMLETGIDGVSRIYRNRDPVAFGILDANDVEKKPGVRRRNVIYLHRTAFLYF
jgi:hypothetical protein